jgi:hypothetical protein
MVAGGICAEVGDVGGDQRHDSDLAANQVARVKPVESTSPDLRLGDDRIDLMSGFSLSSAQAIGGIWEAPPYISPPDTFDERYGQR